MDVNSLIDDFAIRCFRNSADQDYLLARMAFRHDLPQQALWSSLQAIEKYLKCILLLRRIDGRSIHHSLDEALATLARADVPLNLTRASKEFIAHVDRFGECRYLEISVIVFGGQVVDLDRVVWELRRYCTPDGYGYIEKKERGSRLRRILMQDIVLLEGQIPQKYRLAHGVLEKIIDNGKHPARQALLWQNGFFGRRNRRRVRHRGGFRAVNSPLFNHPEILGKLERYVHLPKKLKEAYKNLMVQQR